MKNEPHRTILLLANGSHLIEEGCCYAAYDALGLAFLLKFVVYAEYSHGFNYEDLEIIEMGRGNVLNPDLYDRRFIFIIGIRRIPNEIYDKAKKAHDTYRSALEAITTRIPKELPTNEQVPQSPRRHRRNQV